MKGKGYRYQDFFIHMWYKAEKHAVENRGDVTSVWSSILGKISFPLSVPSSGKTLSLFRSCRMKQAAELKLGDSILCLVWVTDLELNVFLLGSDE